MTALSGLPTTSSNPASATNAFESFSSQDFLKVMFTELTKQDPLQPNDSKALLDQIGSIRAIESDLSLTKRLDEMAKQNEISAAGSLLGKFALGQSSSGAEVSGYVDSVSITREGTVLNLTGGFQVPMSRLIKLVDPALIAPNPPPGTNPTPNPNPNPNPPPPPPPAPQGGTDVPTTTEPVGEETVGAR